MPRKRAKTLSAIVLALCCGLVAGCSDDDEPASQPASTETTTQKAEKKGGDEKQPKKAGKPAGSKDGKDPSAKSEQPPSSLKPVGFRELQVALAEALGEALDEDVPDTAPICSERYKSTSTCLVPLGETTYKYKVLVDADGIWKARGTKATGAVELRESPDSPEGKASAAPELEGQL